MKWTTMQLNRFVNQELVFDGVLDLAEKAEIDADIVRMNDVNVSGRMNIVDGNYLFDISIQTIIYLECAITLEEVPFEIDESFTEIFSTDPIADEVLIEGITIDLSNVIWLSILTVKPMRIVKEGIDSPFEVKSEEKMKNLAFKDLEKYL